MKKPFKFTKEQEAYLIANYTDKQNSELIKHIGCSIRLLYNKAFRLGLKKSKQVIAENARKNLLKPGHGWQKTQFKKGNISLNKGKKRSEFMSEAGILNSQKTQFKKGHRPHNSRKVGYERVQKDGYVYIKIKEPNVFVLKQRYIYEQHYGTIPKGHNIIFKDGNNQNFAIENLECISNAELMNRNTLHQYPQELQNAIKLNNKLQKIIKNETDKHR